jgi:hypothetical protein
MKRLKKTYFHQCVLELNLQPSTACENQVVKIIVAYNTQALSVVASALLPVAINVVLIYIAEEDNRIVQ